MMKAKNVIASLAILSIILILIFILINRLRKKESFEDEVTEIPLWDSTVRGGSSKFMTAVNDIIPIINRVNTNLESYKDDELVPLLVTLNSALGSGMWGGSDAMDLDLNGDFIAEDTEAFNKIQTQLELAITKIEARHLGLSSPASVRDCKNADEDKMDGCCKDFVDTQTDYTNAHLNMSTGVCTLDNKKCPEVEVHFYDVIFNENTIQQILDDFDNSKVEEFGPDILKYSKPTTEAEFEVFYNNILGYKTTEHKQRQQEENKIYHKTSRIILTTYNHIVMNKKMITKLREEIDNDQKLNSDFDASFNNILSLSLNGVEKDDPEVGDKNHLTYSDEHVTEYFERFKDFYSDDQPLYFYHLVF